ncbi:MAG: hypothetical protein FWG90_08875 [Oscillospiraceae bacterium]|nr:hypothetical protein [Oscillospiraceae bacterium]
MKTKIKGLIGMTLALSIVLSFGKGKIIMVSDFFGTLEGDFTYTYTDSKLTVSAYKATSEDGRSFSEIKMETDFSVNKGGQMVSKDLLFNKYHLIFEKVA